MALTVLVTGARGYVGRHLVESLGRRGFSVVAQARAPVPEWSPPPVRVVEGDLTAEATCAEAVAGVDAIVHCAARLRGGGAGEYYRDNVQTTEVLTRAAVSARVPRFIHVSTVEVYGRREHKHTREDAPIDHGDDDPYARTKAWSEAVVRGRTGLPAAILRPGLIWGGPHDDRFLGKVTAALRSRRFAYPGPCDAPLPLLHIENLALAVSLALVSDAQGAFNLTDGTEITFRQLVERLAEHHGLTPPRTTLPLPLVIAAVRGLDAVRSLVLPELMPSLRRGIVELLNTPCRFSIERAKELLGYSPEARGFDA